MQSNILNGGSTTLPDIRGHFRRPRIDKLFDGLIDRHLIVVTAGPGSGKTHAVAGFLKGTQARVFWFQLTALDNNLTKFWEEFIHIMEFQNKDSTSRLEQLGFPETLLKYDKFVHILAKDIYSREQVVFVFDDFHLIHDESILRFFQNLIFAMFENLCIIINSRVDLSFNLTGMFSNNLAGRITAEDLYFTPDETEEYLRYQGIALPAREIKKVQTATEGWPLALYLVGLSIKKGGMVSQDPIAGAIPLIFELIEKEMFSKYSFRIQNFLIRASLLDSFPEDLIKPLAGDHFESISEFMDKDMFISHNPYTGQYNFHHLFLEFLSGKQKQLTQQEMDETYLRAAQWCAAKDLKIEAMAYYNRCDRFDEILNIMFSFGAAIFSRSVAEFYISLIDRFPAELIKNNPLLHVYRAGLLCNNAEVQAAIDELLETQNEIEAMPDSEDNRVVLGEICCMLGIIYLGIANSEFISQFQKASEYLPNGSMMIDYKGAAVNTRYAIMLSSPEPGELHNMEDAIFFAMPYAVKTMHGYGQGLDYLASAEAAYFTGDMKKAGKNAYEAVYRAREMQVLDVASSGYFLLMRIEAANGNYEGVVSNLTLMKNYVEGLENKWNFNGMPDVADGWFNLLFGNTEKVSGWLVDDTLGGSVLAPYSMGMERLIKARYLLKEGKYYELLAWLGQSEKPIRQLNIWLILLDILIYKSIASHYIHEEEQAIAALREAYEIAHGNNIITQFAEQGNDIRNVIYAAKHSELNTIPGAWLDEVYTKAATYEKCLRNMKTQHDQPPGRAAVPLPKLTKREKELLSYLCKGLTNAEIASACFITISAVKKTLNNIYIKLGAANRADAVRIVMQMELIK